MTALDMLARVGLATVLGIAIGLERQWRSRLAGLQTMALVSMGSALYLILSAYTFEDQGDRLRVAAGIVTGIGFLGAGVIMKQGASVTGLNTAATLWATAAVGALAGAWMWREAIAGAVIIVAGNGLLYPLAKSIDRRTFRSGRESVTADYIVEVHCRVADETGLRALVVQALTRPLIQLTSLRATSTADNEVRLRAELRGAGHDDTPLEEAISALILDPRVSSVRWHLADDHAVNWLR